MIRSEQGLTRHLRITEILYLATVVLLFYLLLISRAGEAHTVWEVLHPYFIPTLFVTTFLLLTILLTSEKVAFKLLLVIAYSILIHSLFSIILPGGDLSGQQMVLGRTRLVFDNAFLHGWTWPNMAIQLRVFEWFRGTTFQAALSVVFARMLSIDLLWVHLFLVPVLGGVFTPIAAFWTTKTLGGNEKVSILSSLLISASPYATYFGAISVPNSLGFIFFFYSLYFMLKNLDSNDRKTRALMLIFALFSFLSHPLTGIVSLSILFLALTFKLYKSQKEASPTITEFSLVIAFIFCAVLLPLSFIYLRSLVPSTRTFFTLDKLFELPIQEIAGLLLLGQLTYGFDSKTILLNVIGPVLALLCIIFLLYRLKRNPTAKNRIHIYFLSAAFLIILIDYRILKLLMEDLPLNEERLWVFRDFIAVPFVALAISAIISSLKTFLKATPTPTLSIASLKKSSKINILRALSLLFSLNILIPIVLGGWITFSLTAAYPQAAPLQTTWYELEAVKYIEENTNEKYVVIGDVWTIYAGETIVGINNPRAFYFLEQNKIGHDLFVNMKENPSSQWMLMAMNKTGTDTTVAYFIVTKSRLGAEEYNRIIQQAQQNKLPPYPGGIFYYKGEEKLRIFYYKKPTE